MKICARCDSKISTADYVLAWDKWFHPDCYHDYRRGKIAETAALTQAVPPQQRQQDESGA